MKRAKKVRSRKFQALRNLVLILLLLGLVYLLLDCPPLTAESRFRRAEKEYMVGPSRILGQEELAGGPYDRLILADNGDSVILYAYESELVNSHTLVCREKMGDVTVLAAPAMHHYYYLGARKALDIFVFDDFPDAVRAELEVTLQGQVNSDVFHNTYPLEAQREKEGYFHFQIQPAASDAEGYAMGIFAQISGNYGDSFAYESVPVTVRLYDGADILLAERSLTVRSQAVQAYLDRGEFPE